MRRRRAAIIFISYVFLFYILPLGLPNSILLLLSHGLLRGFTYCCHVHCVFQLKPFETAHQIHFKRQILDLLAKKTVTVKDVIIPS